MEDYLPKTVADARRIAKWGVVDGMPLPPDSSISVIVLSYAEATEILVRALDKERAFSQILAEQLVALLRNQAREG